MTSSSKEKPWDGKERRILNSIGHDMLTRIDTNLENFIDNFKTHIEDDKEEFKSIKDQLVFIQRIIYGVTGVFVFIEFVFKVMK